MATRYDIITPRPGKDGDEFGADDLRELIDYDASTGVFTWKYRPFARAQWNGKWAGKVAGAPRIDGYVQITVKSRNYTAHRLAWLWMTCGWPINEIDHIDGDRSNNKWSNLRLATRSQNSANTRPHKNSRSGIKGVHWYARKRKWQAHIRANGVRMHLGYFKTIKEAADAYAEAAKIYNGQYARTQ